MLKLINHKTIFIHIPKTSGTNFKKIVTEHYSGEYFISNKKFNDVNALIVSILWEKYDNEYVKTGLISTEYFNIIKSTLLFQIDHAPLWVWQKSGMYDDEKVITISRNPYTKFISHYYHILDYLNQYFEFTTPSPTEFINHEKINQILKPDPCSYLLNQVDYIKDESGNIKCDRFYKMETEMEILEKDLSLTNINKFKFNRAYYDKKYSKLYTDELIEFIQNHYKKDFDYFGYDKEPFW